MKTNTTITLHDIYYRFARLQNHYDHSWKGRHNVRLRHGLHFVGWTISDQNEEHWSWNVLRIFTISSNTGSIRCGFGIVYRLKFNLVEWKLSKNRKLQFKKIYDKFTNENYLKYNNYQRNTFIILFIITGNNMAVFTVRNILRSFVHCRIFGVAASRNKKQTAASDHWGRRTIQREA